MAQRTDPTEGTIVVTEVGKGVAAAARSASSGIGSRRPRTRRCVRQRDGRVVGRSRSDVDDRRGRGAVGAPPAPVVRPSSPPMLGEVDRVLSPVVPEVRPEVPVFEPRLGLLRLPDEVLVERLPVELVEPRSLPVREREPLEPLVPMPLVPMPLVPRPLASLRDGDGLDDTPVERVERLPVEVPLELDDLRRLPLVEPTSWVPTPDEPRSPLISLIPSWPPRILRAAITPAVAAAAAATPATTFLVVGLAATERAFDAALWPFDCRVGSFSMPLVEMPPVEPVLVVRTVDVSRPPLRVGFLVVLPVELVIFVLFISVPPREWVGLAAGPGFRRPRSPFDPLKTQERCHHGESPH